MDNKYCTSEKDKKKSERKSKIIHFHDDDCDFDLHISLLGSKTWFDVGYGVHFKFNIL